MERQDFQRQLNKLSGQLEDLRGRMEETFGKPVTGRVHEAKGMAKEQMAEMRGRARELGEAVTEKPIVGLTLGSLALLGMAVLALAVFAPRTFRRYIDRFFDMLGF